MLDIPDVRLGSEPAVNRALHRSVARVLLTAPLLRRLAVRGVLVMLLTGAAAIVPAIGLLSARWAPGLTGPGAVLAATGVCFAAFTTLRYQAALVVAAGAVLDGRSITGRRALAAAGARWKDLAGWLMIDLAPGWSLRQAPQGRAARQHQDSHVASSRPVDRTWPLVTLLVLPVLMFERADVLGAVRRSRQLAADRWGHEAQCRFRRSRAWIKALLMSGSVLAVAGIVVALRGDTSATLAGGLAAAGLLLATTALTARSASRAVLAVALFRYAREGRADDTFDASTLARAVATAPKLIHLLAASGALVPCTSPPIRHGRAAPSPNA